VVHLYPDPVLFPNEPRLDANFVQLAHQAGLKVFGFQYVYGGAFDPIYGEDT
jgi:hypothetical protein